MPTGASKLNTQQSIGVSNASKRNTLPVSITRSEKPCQAIQVERAVRFIYLNRTCFNGIFRVNREGVFNVPIGTKEKVSFPKEFLESVATALQSATIETMDFEDAIGKASKDDFVYADPPYTVKHQNNGFVKYNEKLFSWADQERLARALKSAALRGAAVMLSNAAHKSVQSLYEGFGERQTLTRSSVLSGDPAFRGDAAELLLTNF